MERSKTQARLQSSCLSDQHDKESYEKQHQCDWFFYATPGPVLTAMLGGKAALEQVPELKSRRELYVKLVTQRLP